MFWKVGSRKIYAVSEDNIAEVRNHFEECNSSAEFQQISSKRRKKQYQEEPLETVVMAVDNLREEVAVMKETIDMYRKLCFKHKFSLAFIKSLEDAFECCICKTTPARRPLISCQSCNTIVGCNICVNKWYSGVDGIEKPCPKCREPRGLAKSCQLKGFDGLISNIQALLDGNNSENSDPDDLDDTVTIDRH